MSTSVQQYEHKFAQVADDISIHYVDVGPRDATAIVLIHGWPDLWFGWRHQIGPLSQKYRVIVPDIRGHGDSSAPVDVEHYGYKNITNDLARLLDILEIEKAVFFGHDWGGNTVYRMALYHPDRVIALGSVCTPYFPPSKEYVDLDTLVKAHPTLVYQQFLSQTAEAAKYLDAAPRRLFTAMFRRHSESRGNLSIVDMIKAVPVSDHPAFTVHSDLISDEELDVYEAGYKKSGFQSTLNWYATREIDFKTEKDLPAVISHKALYIGARNDRVLPPEMANHMPQLMPNLEMTVIDDAGHWILWEQHEKVSETILAWVDKLAP